MYKQYDRIKERFNLTYFREVDLGLRKGKKEKRELEGEVMGRKKLYLIEKKELNRELRIMKKIIKIFKARNWYLKLKYLCDSRIPSIEEKLKELKEIKDIELNRKIIINDKFRI